MSNDAAALLGRQFDLVWALAEVHLDALIDADFWFEPAESVWTVRRDADGLWRPDWADAEPHPIPLPTIAWLSWHIAWWWSVTLDHARGVIPRDRTEINWAGSGMAAVAQLRELRAQWRTVLDEADLDGACAFPWGADDPRPLADTAAWVNVELTKNIAEIGQLRLLATLSRAA